MTTEKNQQVTKFTRNSEALNKLMDEAKKTYTYEGIPFIKFEDKKAVVIKVLDEEIIQVQEKKFESEELVNKYLVPIEVKGSKLYWKVSIHVLKEILATTSEKLNVQLDKDNKKYSILELDL